VRVNKSAQHLQYEYEYYLCGPPQYYSPTPHQALNPNNYRRALMCAIPQAITPNPHTNLLNVYIQYIANKIEFQLKKRFLLLSDSCSFVKCKLQACPLVS
jgi:hypothetical protein